MCEGVTGEGSWLWCCCCRPGAVAGHPGGGSIDAPSRVSARERKGVAVAQFATLEQWTSEVVRE